VNGLVYPLQLILLIPFYRAGAWIFGAGSSALSLHGIRAMIGLGAWTTIRTLWVVTLHALVAWLAFGAAATAIPIPKSDGSTEEAQQQRSHLQWDCFQNEMAFEDPLAEASPFAEDSRQVDVELIPRRQSPG
jgi:hypothetical protein